MRRRNPEEQAYRAWQADHSDRGALQRYLSSMARDQEVLDDPERIVELDEAVGQDGALRPIYARVRPDYSNEETSFREERWRTLVDRYAGRQLDPRAVLILVEMGLRSGVAIDNILLDFIRAKLIEFDVFSRLRRFYLNFGSTDPHFVGSCLWSLRAIGSKAAPAIPRIVHMLKNCRSSYAYDNESIRVLCAEVLGKIGPVSETVVCQLTESLRDDEEGLVRAECAKALGEIYQYSESVPALVIQQLIASLRDNILVHAQCVKALGNIGQGAESSVEQIFELLENSGNQYVAEDCRIAIEKITGEAPK